MAPDPAAPFRPVPPLVVGLVGGVAAGKSAVAAGFAARGLRHVDADRIARAVAARPEIATAIESAFGAGVRAQDGGVDRQALGRLVFADERARRQLEAITHPPIRAAIVAEIDAAQQAGESVLLDVPLLIEGGLVERCDVVVFVDAPIDARRARARTRGWSDGELERREAAQLPLVEKRARADFVVDNGGSLDATRRRIDDLLAHLARGPRP